MAFPFRNEELLFPVNRMTRPAIGLAFVASLSACSLLEDRSERYVDAPEGSPLVLPESAEVDRFGQAMPIRDINTADSGKMYPSSIPQPPDMTAEILDENYVIEEVDGRIWLLINDVPGRVWPAVTAYMGDRGLGVAYDSPQLGLMQSELVNFSKKARQLLGLPNTPDGEEASTVVQARITPGVRRKTTEVQFRILEVNEAPEELLPWGAEERADPETAAVRKDLLADMRDFLRSREDSKSYSRAALGMTSEPLVRLESENEEPVAIRMSLDFGRSWAEVQRALEEADIPVVDLDRSKGVFNVDFRPESETEGGWFSWFRDAPEEKHTFDVLLTEQEGSIVVTAERTDSYQGESRSADLLSQLFENLY